jgi:hypothetical protein
MAETTEISEVELEQESRAVADSCACHQSSSEPRSLRFADTMRTETQTNTSAKAAEAVTAIANSPARIYLTVGLYGLLFFGALWASLNLLHWFWHRLL